MSISKLIILRGPSGSGKSSTAKKLRELSTDRVAIVEQDYVRRVILKEKDTPDGHNIALLAAIVLTCLDKGYTVILEGILTRKHYGTMLAQLYTAHPVHNYIYYFDVSLDETLKRHATKPNSQDFGETEMRRWYEASDLLGAPGEKIIAETLNQDEIVALIMGDAVL